MIDYYRRPDALDLNMKLEFSRNNERYQFMKWGMQAFDTFKVVPPGIGIVHQVNLEYLARGVHEKNGVYYPDSLVGTDSHTTMINGIGVVAWGVGGIEAEAGMLGQPVYFLTPDVIGVELKGRLPEGTTATDLVLTVTEMLRKEKVVGKFVEFFGEGTTTLAVPDRATIGNMAPEYGATMGFFPVDQATVDYLRSTGRTSRADRRVRSLLPRTADVRHPARRRDRLFQDGVARPVLYQALALPVPSGRRIASSSAASSRSSRRSSRSPRRRTGSRRRRRSSASAMQRKWAPEGVGEVPADSDSQRTAPGAERQVREMVDNRPIIEDAVEPPTNGDTDIGNGDVLIAAITSCTNTSNPGVLLAAGLLAKKAVEKGLTVKRKVKTSLAPGSRVVTEYLGKAGLLPYLEQLGFGVAAYGCTTCIGNAGDLAAEFNDAIVANDLVCAAVLSGNRNFEARIHPNLKANFLASPPLVVAYAIAGTVLKDITTEPLGIGKDGPVYLKDVWPTSQEVASVMNYAKDPETFRRLYGNLATANPLWGAIEGSTGQVYDWPLSTYIAKPPFFDGFSMATTAISDVKGARALGMFGDSVTTDHISPAGAIKEASPAGQWLLAHGVPRSDFNSYGSRRGNHEVMMRGTFANVRIKNLMLPTRADGTREEGGVTLYQPSGEKMFIYDAAMRYIAAGVPTVVFGGEEYGTGSSRDWAAKGTQLLGVRAVIARSFERIHRSNLVGMGVLPCQFKGTDSAESLGIKGDETFDIIGLEGRLKPQMDVTLAIHRHDGSTQHVPLLLRIDTPIEVDYYMHGGILPFVLRELVREAA